jgi:hypothetical protein
VFGTAPASLPYERLSDADLRRLRDTLGQEGLKLRDGEEADRRLKELRKMYEPYCYSLATYLQLILPPWIPQKKGKDNWQTSAWSEKTGFAEHEAATAAVERHH